MARQEDIDKACREISEHPLAQEMDARADDVRHVAPLWAAGVLSPAKLAMYLLRSRIEDDERHYDVPDLDRDLEG